MLHRRIHRLPPPPRRIPCPLHRHRLRRTRMETPSRRPHQRPRTLQRAPHRATPWSCRNQRRGSDRHGPRMDQTRTSPRRGAYLAQRRWQNHLTRQTPLRSDQRRTPRRHDPHRRPRTRDRRASPSDPPRHGMGSPRMDPIPNPRQRTKQETQKQRQRQPRMACAAHAYETIKNRVHSDAARKFIMSSTHATRR